MIDDAYWRDLARRAVACQRWRWMPGMLAIGEAVDRLTRIDTTQPMAWQGQLRVVTVDAIGHGYVDGELDYQLVPGECVPDLRDPATLGCLLALVREACGAPVYVIPEADQDGNVFGYGCYRPAPGWAHDSAEEVPPVDYSVGAPEWIRPTEAEALVAALEAAPLPTTAALAITATRGRRSARGRRPAAP